MFDDAYLDLPCPKCGQKTKKTLGWVKAHDRFVCAHCQTEIKFDKSKFTGPMNELDQSLEDLERTLKRLGQ